MRYTTLEQFNNEHDFLVKHGFIKVSERVNEYGKRSTRYENENRYTVNLVEC